MRTDFALKLYKEIAARWIEICRGAIENLLTAKEPQWIEQLSRSYRADKNFLNGSRICREAIETNSRKLWWIEDALRPIEKSIEFDEKQFFKEKKNTKMNAIKQATQPKFQKTL